MIIEDEGAGTPDLERRERRSLGWRDAEDDDPHIDADYMIQAGDETRLKVVRLRGSGSSAGVRT